MLVFDDGLGGFLPLSQADLPCDPLSFAEAGIAPSPASLMVMADGVCVVKQTRRALYRHWQLAEGEAPAVRGLLARAARITTEITLGRGDAGHLAALDDLALELTDARPGRRLAAGQFAAPLPRAVGAACAARVVPRRRCAWTCRTTPRPATAPARPTSTSPASWPTWATATTAPRSRSSGATTRCR